MPVKPLISVVSPVYGAEGIIQELVKQISASVETITSNFEIILIEDHSPDKSWIEMQSEAAKDRRVKVVKLSRNFGQHNAIAAALELAQGDYVVLMDCDLQHNPVYIPQLYSKILEGYDLVYTKTRTREHSFFKNLTARGYYKFLKLISDFDMDPNIGSYSMLSRKVVDAYNRYPDYKKAYLWALRWLGFKSAILPIEHHSRFAGQSAYSIRKLLKQALNVAVSNSDKLLYLAVYLGVFVSFFAFIGASYIFLRYLFSNVLAGWTSLIVCIMFFSGLILSCIGISAIYIANTFEQAKGRPRYVISETKNFE
jgi:glycosyltransferase involved in cell wall biosynthesis